MYAELARGGVGLIITGHMFVRPDGKAHLEQAGAHCDDFLPELSSLAQAAHGEGGKIAVQLNFAGLRAWPEVLEGRPPLAPSAVADPRSETVGREMSPQEIRELAAAYGQAARRMKEAGFDAVQIHGAHGYMVSQFLSPLTNRRQDRWGGDIQGRMAFLLAVYGEIRAQVGEEYPVMIKLGMADGIEGGLRLEESLEVVRRLEEAGIALIEISCGFGGERFQPIGAQPSSPEEEGYFLPWARAIRRTSQVPLALVGGLRSQAVMEGIVEGGLADFVSLSRPFLREPDFVNRLRVGLEGASPCISCGRCNLRWGSPVVCPPAEEE
jgi:2,4-dienoyl-CoA reductase-like NADH-dependent reductase (Old Yellow Enzyme family)